MQDELEILKKDWQKQSAELPKFTASELYPMLLKKSSSIVKWIFIVSILEFAFWILLSLLPVSSDGDIKVEGGLEILLTYVVPITHLSALLFFVTWFYQNYSKIKSTDTAKELLKNILKTRKTVTYYIRFSILFLLISTTIAFIFIVQDNPEGYGDKSLAILVLQFIGIISVFIGLLWAVYSLIYGILMKKLTSNYKELKKLEV